MKVGIVGLGSIGRRHAAVLHSLGAEVFALRSDEGALKGLPPNLGYVRERFDKASFFAVGLDAAIVATPTALHPDGLAACAAARVRTLVEKPLAASVLSVPPLSAEVRGATRVGYSLRFHPVSRCVQELLEEGRLGQVHKARLAFGSYLPGWHPEIDYRTEYMARHDLGGGVLRTASHEIDLLCYWLGPVIAVAGDVRKVSDLAIDVDDVATVVCRMASGASAVVELDFLSPRYVREGTLLGERGRLDYSLNPAFVRFTPRGQTGTVTVLETEAGEAFSVMYDEQARDLLAFARGDGSAACSLAEALHVMAIIEAAERSGPRDLTAISPATPGLADEARP